MPVTLLEAKNALYPFVDNGVCPTDSRVVSRINEAQRRLHSYRAWLGVLARYSVAVENREFTLPPTLYVGTSTIPAISNVEGFGLESALRVSSTTATEGFLTNSVQAFVTDGGSILPLNFVQTDFRKYRIEGSDAPERVEITGKLNYVPATADNHLLVIDDLDALKLMLLALYREENNQLEMAQALETKAADRLALKTDRAVETARRLNYQTRVANEIPGSLGEFRSRFALDSAFGVKIDDAEIVNLINDAEEALFSRGTWFGTIKNFHVSVTANNEILLPTGVGAILGVCFGNKPISIFDRNYDFHENGPGYSQKDSFGSDVLIDRGEIYVNGQWMRKFFLRSSNNPECIEILAKKRWLRKNLDTDKLDIRNYQAVREMALSLQGADKNPEVSMFHENKAISILKQELAELRGSARNQFRVQAENFALGEVTALV